MNQHAPCLKPWALTMVSRVQSKRHVTIHTLWTPSLWGCAHSLHHKPEGNKHHMCCSDDTTHKVCSDCCLTSVDGLASHHPPPQTNDCIQVDTHSIWGTYGLLLLFRVDNKGVHDIWIAQNSNATCMCVQELSVDNSHDILPNCKQHYTIWSCFSSPGTKPQTRLQKHLFVHIIYIIEARLRALCPCCRSGCVVVVFLLLLL